MIAKRQRRSTEHDWSLEQFNSGTLCDCASSTMPLPPLTKPPRRGWRHCGSPERRGAALVRGDLRAQVATRIVATRKTQSAHCIIVHCASSVCLVLFTVFLPHTASVIPKCTFRSRLVSFNIHDVTYAFSNVNCISNLVRPCLSREPVSLPPPSPLPPPPPIDNPNGPGFDVGLVELSLSGSV